MTDSEAATADAGPATGAADDPTPDDDAYSGLFGAFPYAFRATDSRLCKLYVAVGGLLGGLLAVGFGFAFVVQVFNTLSGTGGTFTFSRALFLLVGLFVVGPVLAPVLLVARRHRRTGGDTRYDSLLAVSGFLFLLSLYLFALGASSPGLRDPASAAGPFEPLVAALYALPSVAAFVFPLAAAAVIYGAHRYAR
ncbi:hypothetical protein [Haloglomus halophilum]|uniref:hypothetical protein n=1 Tax=Haloglomus halophilum TaxID=2962672 RepID=UPI0020CA1044|nr:hypothetical protein [Haloglomus halophilum]